MSFKYPEVVHNHYTYKDSVDNHNIRRMFPVAIEKQWRTNMWPNRPFAFLLAVTEVNCNLVNHHIYKVPSMEQIRFRYQVANQLIQNEYYNRKKTNKRAKRVQVIVNRHKHVSLPVYKNFKESKIVDTKSRWPQWKCKSCQRKSTRSYCT